MSSPPHTLGHCICKSHLPRPWNRPEHWTAKEVAYLEASYGLVATEAIAKHLHRSVTGVRMKAKALGVRMRDVGLSAREVARILGVEESSVGKLLIRKHRLLNATRPHRRGSHPVHMVTEAELTRFIREHGEWVDVDRMPDSYYRDVALEGGRWYPLPALLRLTGRHPHALAAEVRRGRWPARRRGPHWMVHESLLPAIRASVRRPADPVRREHTLAHLRNVRKGIEQPRPRKRAA